MRSVISCLWLTASLCFGQTSIADRVVNVRESGARGDGVTLDTVAIQGAIDRCSGAGGGTVVFPAGAYLTGTLHLRSHVNLHLETGAVLAGTTNLDHYSYPAVPASLPEARWGKWHRGLLVGQSIEDVVIGGTGTIDGRKVYDPTGEERQRGPHTIVLVDCRRVTLRDISIVDSANYAVFFLISDEVEIRNMKFTGGWDGVHWRGSPSRWCRNVKIIDSQFYTGDDAIAGRYWENTLISGCIINSSCNGIRLIGPATHLLVSHCVFYGPGEHPHRTSARTNMLSGIILQPGAWDATQGLLDEVLVANCTMRDVASPVTLWTKTNNPVGKVTISGLQATGVYRSALSAESWWEAPITNVILKASSIEFAGGLRPEQAPSSVKGPGVDARVLPAWGIFARNVYSLTVHDVRLQTTKADYRPVVLLEDVREMIQDNLNFSPPPPGVEPVIERE